VRPVTLELFAKSGRAVSAGAPDSEEYFSRLLRSGWVGGSEIGGDTELSGEIGGKCVAVIYAFFALKRHFRQSTTVTGQADPIRRDSPRFAKGRPGVPWTFRRCWTVSCWLGWAVGGGWGRAESAGQCHPSHWNFSRNLTELFGLARRIVGSISADCRDRVRCGAARSLATLKFPARSGEMCGGYPRFWRSPTAFWPECHSDGSG